MDKKIYNKLVRDNIPSIIEADGAIPLIRVLNDNELAESLNHKLLEEVQEFLLNLEIEELADIYEVMLAILDNRNIPFDEFQKICEKKRAERGGFKEKLFLISVQK